MSGKEIVGWSSLRKIVVLIQLHGIAVTKNSRVPDIAQTQFIFDEHKPQITLIEQLGVREVVILLVFYILPLDNRFAHVLIP
jgi:hypothetical protein